MDNLPLPLIPQNMEFENRITLLPQEEVTTNLPEVTNRLLLQGENPTWMKCHLLPNHLNLMDQDKTSTKLLTTSTLM